MFMEIGEPEPPPIAEGAYWAFMPVAILLAIPGVLRVSAAVFQQQLVAPVAFVLDQYEALLLMPLSWLHETARRLLPSVWQDWVPGQVLVFSFAGATFIASWFVARLQRVLGIIGGVLLALFLAAGLGATFLGLGFLAVAYFLVTVGDGLVVLVLDEGKANTWAIVLPLLAPLVLAAVILGANAIV